MGTDKEGAAVEKETELAGCVVMIPALDPAPELLSYAAALLARSPEALVVVDDGSGPGSREIFAALEALDRCTVLRHPANRGKGRAMKTAFAYILNQSAWTGCAVVTADADGQHSVSDVCAVGRAARAAGDRLVLGVRDLGLPSVPARSKVGNRLSSWAFHSLYGVRLEDTQTGLRGVPWELLPWCGEIKGERFEYEMNMLIRAVQEHRALEEVTIQVIYFDNNRGTHLRAVRDSWRVFLVLVSGLGWYALSSTLSAAADVLTFWLCSAVIFRPLPPLYCYWWSTLSARALSSSLNYTLNRRYVFGARPRGRTLLRYYLLWGSQLLCSYLLLLALERLLPGIYPTVNKALGDIILALCSYQIQLRWVFREDGRP